MSLSQSTFVQFAGPRDILTKRKASDIVGAVLSAGDDEEVSMRVLPVIVAMLVGGESMAMARAPAAGSCGPNPLQPGTSAGVVMVEVNWHQLAVCVAAKKAVETRIAVRVTSENPLRFHLHHFNFINYTPRYQIEETVIESYVTIEKLFAQLFGLAGLVAGARPAARATRGACASFSQCLANWYWLIVQADESVQEAVTAYRGKTALDDTEINQVDKTRVTLEEIRREILLALADTKTFPPSSIQEIEQYEQVRVRHGQILNRLDAYSAAAKLTKDGQFKVIPKEKAGTLVEVTITPMDEAKGEATPTLTAEYFVHSRLPVVFHSGYAYSALDDVKFDKVRTLSGADLYSAIRNDETTSTMTAFLSAGRSWSDDTWGAYGTVGTDFQKPGDRLYVAGSLQIFKRIFVNGGFASSSVEEGVDEVFEQLPGDATPRELFTAVVGRRQWEPFFGISFRVF